MRKRMNRISDNDRIAEDAYSHYLAAFFLSFDAVVDFLPFDLALVDFFAVDFLPADFFAIDFFPVDLLADFPFAGVR